MILFIIIVVVGVLSILAINQKNLSPRARARAANIAMTDEEFEQAWEGALRYQAYLRARRQPKMVFMQDGEFVAGEDISPGDLVYLSPQTKKDVPG